MSEPEFSPITAKGVQCQHGAMVAIIGERDSHGFETVVIPVFPWPCNEDDCTQDALENYLRPAIPGPRVGGAW